MIEIAEANSVFFIFCDSMVQYKRGYYDWTRTSQLGKITDESLRGRKA